MMLKKPIDELTTTDIVLWVQFAHCFLDHVESFYNFLMARKWVICRLETYIGNKLDWKHFF